MRSIRSIAACSVVCASSLAMAQGSVGTAFTYQGELRSSGAAATGTYDFEFMLFDASVGAGQVGGTLCADNVEVVDGQFTVKLDFGSVFAGSKRFLEVHVREDGGSDCSVAGGYSTLTPRQELTASPHAVFASSAASALNAGSLAGQTGAFYQNAANLTGVLDAARIPTLDASKIGTGVLSNARTSGTSANSPGTLVMRDGAGNFAANTIFGTLTGNATSATNAQQLAGRVPSSADSANTIVSRDPSGNFAANMIFASLTGNASTATNAQQLAGRVPSSADSPNTIVSRDPSGNFAANMIFASLTGNASTATNAQQLAGRVPSSANSPNTIVSRDPFGNFAANIIVGTLSGNASSATNAQQLEGRVQSVLNVPNTIVSRDSAGNFAANIIVGTLSGNASSATNAQQLEGRVQSVLNVPNTIVSRDSAGNFAANIIVGTLSGNASSATNAQQLDGRAQSVLNVPNTIVSRDSAGNFAANIIVGTLSGNASSATNAQQLDGRAQSVLNAPNTIVSRDPAGNFSANIIVGTLSGNASSATNSTQLGGQPATFYRNADNLNAGTVPDARIGANVPRLSATNIFTGASSTFPRLVVGAPTLATELDVDGRMQLSDGVIQRGGASVISGTSDLGLYSQVAGDWIRFVTNGGNFNWFTDSGMGTFSRMTLSAGGLLTVSGNASVVGSLSKGGGSFKIDHPLDPKNKYLYHSFVESPDMMNVYNGVVTLDSLGQAQVELPDYFEALNRDYRYQLTCIGGFAPVYISQKVEGNTFAIAGGTPGLEVSWQVTGIRQDAWAQKNRIPNSVEKAGAERGKLLHPEAFGEPESSGIQSIPMSRPSSAGQ